MRRIISLSLATALSVAMMVPAPASAATDLTGFVPDFTKAIPFLNQGGSSTVGGVTVTATANTGVAGGGNRYLHQSNARLQTILTFSPAIPGFQAETANHADCLGAAGAPANCFEQYDLVGKDSTGTVVFTSVIRNSNQTKSFVPGAVTTDALTGLITTLQIDYTHDTPAPDFLRGSYLTLSLTDSSITPGTQTVTGTTGSAITATAAYQTKGIAGAVTYAVTNGTLPAGLQLNASTGVISGTPTSASTATVTITATGASSGSATATVTFSVTTPTTTVPRTTTPPTTAAPEAATSSKGGSPSTALSELPATGNDDSATLPWALLLLVVGVTTTAIGRRRRTTTR